MKKKIFCLLLILILPICLMFSGCSKNPKSDNYFTEKNNRFVFVKNYTDNGKVNFKILVDKETRVMYLYYIYEKSMKYDYKTGLTVMVDSDGKPLIYEGEL